MIINVFGSTENGPFRNGDCIDNGLIGISILTMKIVRNACHTIDQTENHIYRYVFNIVEKWRVTIIINHSYLQLTPNVAIAMAEV